MVDYKQWMKKALYQAKLAEQKGEIPVGAIVTLGDRVVGQGHNSVITLKDPTAHAEMIAITAAAQCLNSEILDECVLYTTLEPCPMCAGAIILARMKKVVFAAMDAKYGAAGSVYNLLQEGKMNHKVNVIGGIEELEAKELLQSFFKKLRSKNEECY